MNYQTLFSGTNKRNIVNLLSAENAHTVVTVKANENITKKKRCFMIHFIFSEDIISTELLTSIGKRFFIHHFILNGKIDL